jgi:hypothetical protein
MGITCFGCKFKKKDWISKEMSVKMLNLAVKNEDLCRFFLILPCERQKKRADSLKNEA